jgi:hypothetical protein
LVTGNAGASIGASVSIDETADRSFSVANLTSETLVLDIGGIPFTFQFVVPISIGYHAK